MVEYAMYPKNGKESINKTNQFTTIREATIYFAGVKQMSVEEFNKIFIVTEIKNKINETH
jgi:hypothetical protein